MIRALGEDVRSLLRSGVAVASLTQCVDELVVNSLDAGATCITVRVDIAALRVQVTDNGSGISRDNLNALGERYSTSKCYSLTDLNDIKFYGFRGEALASIRDIAGILEVVTRHKSSYKTYCKIFRSSKVVEITESCIPRPSVGTTVTVYDVFSSLPVRRKLVSDVLDFERIRQRLASIALVNPGVSFSLYNDTTGQKCLQTRKCQSIISTFSQLFGNIKAKSLQEVSLESGDVATSGYIGTQTHHNKNLQFVYVNGRLLMKTRIHKLVNHILNKSLLVKNPALTNDNGETGSVNSPPKQGCEKYAIYVLNITCPVMNYDITLEPSKTLVEFEDWDAVLGLIKRCTESFLVKQNLMLPADTEDLVDTQDSSDSQVDLSIYEYQSDTAKSDYSINPANIKKSLQSSVVSRNTDQNENAAKSSRESVELTGKTEKLQTKPTEKVTIKDSSCPRQNRKANLQSTTATSPSQKQGREESPAFPGKAQRNSIQLGNCFTSPNPITLKSRKPRKRVHVGSAKNSADIATHCSFAFTSRKSDMPHLNSLDEVNESRTESTPDSVKVQGFCSITDTAENINNDEDVDHIRNDECHLDTSTSDCCGTQKSRAVDHPNDNLSLAPQNNEELCDDDLIKAFNIDKSISEHQEEASTVALHSGSDRNTVDIDRRDEASCLSADWQVIHDSNLNKNIYYNIRSGNTVFECPVNKDNGPTNQDSSSVNTVTLACAPHISFDCTPWLPRDDRQRRRTTNVESLETQERTATLLSNMLDEWENPVFESVPEMDVTNLSKPTVTRNSLHKAVLSYRFTKEMVKALHVIKQVDNKFIVCQVQERDTEHDSLVVLLDQHAVHERIRLEGLTADLFITTSQSDGSLPSIKSSAVSPPIELEFTPHDFLLVKRFRSELGRVGIKFVIGCCSESSEPRSIIIHELPCVFVEREVSETRRRRPSVAVPIVKELIESHIEHLKQTNGVSPAIPKTILRVLSSQACHGAIKFGEALTTKECEQLIQQLSSCDLPFQCAHGRPSIIPLVDLKLLESKQLDSETLCKPPKLSRLTNAIAQ